jgi:hypothetical protein
MSVIGKINVNFFVFSEFDPTVLIVADNSRWLHIEGKRSVIDITLPGASKPITFEYLKNGVNTFNSHNLKITCLKGDCTDEVYGELPDGIYTITVKGSPSTFFKTKYHLKTDRLNQVIDKNLIDLGYYFDEEKVKQRDELLNVKVYLMQAEAYIRREDIQLAKKFYELAKEEMDRIDECNN